ncbi:VOC family protein [Granulosicoccus sp.]|nr:VOC family protein [Granulosicoccus sp.]MDB4223059.1 VOC family protein [Granulosicoccus sp.]
MTDENPSILSHVSIGTNDLERSAQFYDKILAPLGIARVETLAGEAVAFGKQYPEFWVVIPHDDQVATVGNGTHIGFISNSKAAVQAFYEAALNAGGTDCGAPGPRPLYGDPYYGCFIIDPDGHKIEASFWDSSAI